MVFSLLLAMFGIGAFCVLLYNAAVFALPGAIGFEAGYWAIKSGAGPIGGIAIGFLVGGFIFVLGQAVMSTTRSDVVRMSVVLLFVIPAVIAGYNGVLELAGLGSASAIWQHIFAVIGSIVIGATAFTRLITPIGDAGGPSPLTHR